MIRREKFRELCILIITLCLFISIPISVLSDIGGIRNTKHNLSGSSSKWPGKFSVKAVEEREICIFCHIPHNANPAYPLWNHEVSAVTSYIPYFSNTLQSYASPASAPAVDGISKLCLSCHDGTVGVGSVNSRFQDILLEASPCIDASGKLINAPGCTGYVGTDLSGGHPISIIFDDSLAARRNNHIPPLSNLNYPSTINDPDVKLYPTHGGRGVQCSSCHDPHDSKAVWPPFWRKSSHDGVCNVCHQQIPPNSNITW